MVKFVYKHQIPYLTRFNSIIVETIFHIGRLYIPYWTQTSYIFHYRDKDQVEVDFVLENSDNKVIGIEVKASRTIYNQDFKGLRKLASLAKSDWISGLILYNGDICLSFGENLWAIPFSFLD